MHSASAVVEFERSIMKKMHSLGVAAALAVLALGAQAADPFGTGYGPANAQNNSTLTRAQVTADYQAARQNNTLLVNGNSLRRRPDEMSHTSTVSRADVQAQTSAAVHDMNYGRGGM